MISSVTEPRGRLGMRVVALVLAAVVPLAGAATGCSYAERRPVTPSTASAYPSLTDQQVAKIIAQIDSDIKAADKATSPERLKQRLEDPAYTMRAAQYVLKQKDDQNNFGPIPTKPVSVTVTSTTSWPRAIIDVTAAPPNSLPYVLVIRQHDVHAAYRLWQWMRVLPGKSVPATAIVKKGSPALSADKIGLLPMSPNAVRDLWAKAVLDPKAQQSGNVAEDVLMTSIRTEQKQLSDAVGGAGTVQAQITPGKDVVAVALSDGGALVACNYSYRTTITVNDGSPGIQAQGDVGQILGDDGKITSKAHWTYAVTTLLRVPPAKAKKKHIEVIAGEKVLYEAARE